ncbi:MULTISPECIES: Tfp pilus assembly protein FimT/FimU [unclassified Thermosynechococcus]|uniref:pilus assembly FimT family protein n=1 Tax=unclassified Thermosynechococcus TaxID=2622553 RepID=UPI00267288CB|nr:MULTISPECIES: type II secretion system protein [unclassified Thermosynechococcus]MDR5639225.1 type II secretion system protein [Thermosynechococcus sp. PP42]WKT80172.1 type II secretion system protein [Thermosynechococcus sp. PP45]WNC23782.1 type II secretion system protein [Thermosynechococcus sp. PP551]WNC26358.1 type II secretion system protein [Thermosynechococcus sp. PP555]WNC31490.1 type II secretion system protein [Thermosynechococcus sp. PKX95]
MNSRQRGYTMTEILVVIVLIAILVGIGTMTLFPLLQRQRVRAAVNTARNVLRLAQANAKREKLPWIAAFRNTDFGPQWSTNPVNRDRRDWQWQPLVDDDEQLVMVMYATDFNSTEVGEGNRILECWQPQARSAAVQQCELAFDHQGRVITPVTPRRIAFSIYAYEDEYLQCVRIPTILGGMRIEQGTSCGVYRE